MKKLVILILCICFIVVMPTLAIDSIQPDDFDEDGTPIYYIDVSPEEWEKTYLDHPYYKNYNPKEKAIFRLREENNTKAICYVCGRNSMTLYQEWSELESMSRVCPGDWAGSDMRVAHTWIYGDYCTYCGLIGDWTWNPDRETWSWAMHCYFFDYENPYPIYVGASIKDGYGVHNCYSIVKNHNGIVHGYNCDCH